MKKIYLLMLLVMAAVGLSAQNGFSDDLQAQETEVKYAEPEFKTLPADGAKEMQLGKPYARKAQKAAVAKAAQAAQYGYGFGVEGYVKVPLASPTKETVEIKGKLYVSGGVRIGDELLLAEYDPTSSIMQATYLTRFNLNTRTAVRTVKLSSDSPVAIGMAYSMPTGKVYCLATFWRKVNNISSQHQAFYTLDPSTGVFTKIKDTEEHYMGITANRAGQIFAVTSTGQLATFDPVTGYVTKIGKSSITKTAKYISGLDMDFETNTIYWPLCDSNGASWLFSIDAATGTGKQIGRIGTGTEEIMAFHVDRYTPATTAPAKVADLTFTPGASGASTATMTWTNPTKTVGGETLSSLTKVNVYLNGTLYKELTTAPGEKNSLSLTGLSTGYNRVGVMTVSGDEESERAENMAWIGLDIPTAVTDITLERTSPKLATLTWKAPTGGGMHGGYVKTSALKYRITRFNAEGDSVVVAKTYRKDLTYLDSTITKLSTYYYRIQSLTSDYGDMAESGEKVLGPTLDVPYYCTFGTDAAFKQWTLIDGNNDGICWTNYSYGKYVYHNTKGLKADDWMLTPPLNLKADSTYYVYFVFRSGLGEWYPKHLQVTYGKTDKPADQTVIKEYQIASRVDEYARIALPIKESGEYFIGIRDVSDFTSANIRLTNFVVMTKHTGWLTGKVTDKTGAPVEGVTVKIPGTDIVDTTAVDGSYKLDFVPTGRYAVNYSKLYWTTVEDSIDFVNDKETVHNVTLSKLPTHTVSGKLTDVAGNNVVNATVTLSGYGDDLVTRTDAEGKFNISGVAEEYYGFKVSKIKYVNYKDSFSVAKDTVINLVMSPKILAPSEYAVAAAGQNVNLTWKAPREVFRHDNGVFESQLGSLAGNEKYINGAVFRTPAVLKKMSWVTTSYQGPHNYMNLWIFDVTDDFKPTNKVLFNVMNVPTKGDEVWNEYELPEPVEAPNGYFLGVSYNNGMSSLATDSGTDEDYPFIPYTNYSSADYTTNVWQCKDASFIKRNHLIRAEGDEIGNNPQQYAYKYVVWRFVEDDFLDQDKWTLLTPAEGISDLQLADNVSALADGNYVYAIAAIYPDKQYSEILYSDNVKVAGHTGIETAQVANKFIIEKNADGTALNVNMTCDRMDIYSVSGTLSSSATGASSINVSSLADGVYVLKATVGKSTVIKTIVIKK